MDADASAYLLGPDGRVRGDADRVFYNQPVGGDGAVRLVDGAFAVAVAAVPAAIDRIVFCVTMGGGRTLAAIDGAMISVGGGAVLSFRPALAGATEAAMIFGELYRRQGQWKFRGVGQGFDGGLAPLARSSGIDVAEASAPPPPVSLTKVMLDKSRQSVSLAKPTGEVVVNLNWATARTQLPRRSILTLAVLRTGGRLSLGRPGAGRHLRRVRRGTVDRLSGDDRSGAVASGETLRVNARHWDRIRRILVFATIYEGVPNWQATDGVVTVTLPGQSEVTVP